VFKYLFTTLLMSLFLIVGCQQQQNPGPDGGPDPSTQAERYTPYNVTKEKAQADLVGRWLTLNTNSRYRFDKTDDISLEEMTDPHVLSKTEVVSYWRLFCTNKARPNEGVSGFIKLRYEHVDGQWHLTEVIRDTVDHWKKREK